MLKVIYNFIMKTYKTSLARKLSIYGFDAVQNSHNFLAILEFDVSGLRKHLREKRIAGNGGSLFVFFLKAIAKCLVEFPSFNAMINHRKTTVFETVDISVPIEINRDGEVENKQYLIRDADKKPLRVIDDEIRASKKAVDEQKGFILSRPVQTLFSLLPRKIAASLLKALLKNHKKVMALSGSVFVTSISMFSDIPGYVIPYSGGPKACSFAIGSVVKKPVVEKDSIVIRETVNVTAVFNHDIVDGAPAARFINRLREIIEKEHDGIE